MQGILIGRDQMEDTAKQVSIYPLFNDYWAAKRIPVDEIDIPIYQTASYSWASHDWKKELESLADHKDLSSFIHTHGSIRTFREAKSKNKWSVLGLHRSFLG